MRSFRANMPLYLASLAAGVLFIIATAFFKWQLAVTEAVVLLLLVVAFFIRYKYIGDKIDKSIRQLMAAFDFSQKEAVEEFPLPVVTADSHGSIIWYNDLFKARVLEDKELFSDDVGVVTGGATLEELADSSGAPVTYGGRMYTVYACALHTGAKASYVLFFIDDTSLKQIAKEYEGARPVVMYISADNINEVAQNFRDSDRAALSSGVEKIIENWVSDYGGFLCRLKEGKFLMITEERHLDRITADKFNVLEKMRKFTYGNTGGVTLSIGVGRGNQIKESADNAKQALDMALGRGGDQAAVKQRDGYAFFGGVSMGMEKRNKVHTRITAAAIEELIEGSERVLVMGHRFADLDVLGAATGLYSAAVAQKKEAYIVMSRSKTLSMPLVKRMEEQGRGAMIIEPERAMELLTKRTLLVIVDTHRPDFVECPPLYQAAQTVIVIDHHRKGVDHITNAVLFFHEPGASSASEMVTELLQYMGQRGNKPVLGKLEAEALLAGIMLDTRNFIMRTGVRTFEAAAYLKSCGADTVSVKQLFSDDIEDYKMRNVVVSNSDLYRGCAIAIADVENDDIRVVASQAADELLNISGVRASFVLFRADHMVNISARSMGKMNVQLIMESIGGGGHQTMAATQMAEITLSDAKVRLLSAIDQYYAAVGQTETEDAT